MFARKFSTFLTAVLIGLPCAASAAAPVIDVYKSATCGCCKDWIKHLEANGFTVVAHDVANPSDYREKFHMPDQFGSCHSAKVQGYAIEGHVPASQIKQLLATKPKAVGLAVPAMPMGAPGMEGPRHDPYDVLLVREGKPATVYKHYD